MGPALGFTIEAQKSFNNAKYKSVLKTLLDAESNFITNKTNKEPLDLFKPIKDPLLGSGLTITNNEVKDIIKVILSL